LFKYYNVVIWINTMMLIIFFFFFKTVFTIQRLLWFPINFRTFFLFLKKMLTGFW
jgi:hypothetical protein